MLIRLLDTCRLNEIRVLKIKLGDLKRQLLILMNSVANIDVLKHEVHHLGRDLLQVGLVCCVQEEACLYLNGSGNGVFQVQEGFMTLTGDSRARVVCELRGNAWGWQAPLSHCNCVGLCNDFLLVGLLHTTCCSGHWISLPVCGPREQRELAVLFWLPPALAVIWAGTCTASAWGNSLAGICCRWD